MLSNSVSSNNFITVFDNIFVIGNYNVTYLYQDMPANAIGIAFEEENFLGRIIDFFKASGQNYGFSGRIFTSAKKCTPRIDDL